MYFWIFICFCFGLFTYVFLLGDLMSTRRGGRFQEGLDLPSLAAEGEGEGRSKATVGAAIVARATNRHQR